MVKAVAVSRGIELRSHGEPHGFAVKLSEKMREPKLRHLWFTATSLHQNFYENWLPPTAVSEGVMDVKEFVDRLKALLT